MNFFISDVIVSNTPATIRGGYNYLLISNLLISHNNNLPMKKELYSSPEVHVVEVKMEGVIATSIPNVPYGEDLF